MALLGRARELEAAGRDIIHLEVGEPDFPTPQAVCRAARRLLQDGRVGYTAALGHPELRRAIARFYRSREGVELDWRRVVVTPGASGALSLAMAATLDPGDALLLGEPGYPSNRHLASLFSVHPRILPLTPQTGFQPDAATVSASWQGDVRALLLTSPANPTGAVIEAESLQALVETVADRGGWLLMDEIYRGLIYGTPPPTVLRFTDRAWVINSFSKYFAMTGWRLGWLVVPEEAVAAVERLAQNLFLSPSALAQEAARAVFQPEVLAELEQRREVLQRRRDYLLAALEGLGFRVPVPPRGAFYLYADCSSLGADGEILARRFLEEGGVAVTPGVDFDPAGGRSYLRFAFTAPLERLQEAVARLERLV